MTIRTKLTVNIFFVIAIVAAVVATSIWGMTTVREKLKFLTQRSTPFQMRTAELQGALEGAGTELAKIGTARSLDDFKVRRKSTDEHLAVLKKSQDTLEQLSGDRYETHGAISQAAEELFKITEARLASEREALESKQAVIGRLKSVTDKVAKLSHRVDKLQNDKLGQFTALLEEAKDIDVVRDSPSVAQFGIATKLQMMTSQLAQCSLSLDALATSVFSKRNEKELAGVTAEADRISKTARDAAKSAEGFLVRLKANDEVKLLKEIVGGLAATQGQIGTIVTKYRNYLDAQEKAAQVGVKIAQIADQQADKGKTTVSSAQSEQEKAIGTVNQMVKTSITLVLAIGIAAVVIGIGFGFWIYRSIQRPLKSLMAVSGQVAAGDLNVEIDTNSNDEIGRVQQEMARMVASLSDVVGRLKAATVTLSTEADCLKGTAGELSEGGSSQEQQVITSVTAINQMAQTAGDISRNTSETADAATRMRQSALTGKDAIGSTGNELAKFSNSFTVSAEKVESLGEKSTEIAEVVALIKDIADQTNLLALNAAIEAARAGEHGMGFAVVADEVRKLAERTTRATDDIAKTVRGMQEEIEGSVSFMQSEKDSVSQVLANVQGTLSSIDDIAHSVEQVSDMVQRIAVATEEQTSTAEEVARNMDGINQVTQQMGQSVTNITRSADGLTRVVGEIDHVVGWFRVA